MKVTILCASNKNNLELGNKLAAKASELGLNPKIVNLAELDLPLYSTTEESKGIPSIASELTNELSSSAALIVLAPEYNGGIPPLLNNTIAWISRSNKDWREAFNDKAVLLGSHSGGGGSHVLLAMRMQLSYLGANVIGRQIQVNGQKPYSEETATDCLMRLKKATKV